MESEGVKPDFDVFGCDENLGPGEYFVVCCVTISFESCLDKGSLFFAEPADGVGVV